MRIPQPPERVKEAPAQALRAVFAGVGQILLLTERVRQRTIAQVHTGRVSDSAPVRGPEGPDTVAGVGIRPGSRPAGPAHAKADAAQAKASSATAGAPVHKQRTLQAKGHVRMVETAPAQAPAPEAAAPEAAAPEATATPEVTTAPETTAVPEATAPEATVSEATVSEATVSEVDAADLPVPNYSELSVASLRARLRGLDAGQVGALLDYERAHAGRANVITMFERRIAKLEGPDDTHSAAG